MENIVSVEWLNDKVSSGNVEGIRILDVTLGAKEQYDKGHIPGSVFFDIIYKAEHTEYLRRNLPKPEHFQEAARLAGINKDTHVVVVDGGGTNGFYFGGRAWWMFYIHGHEKVSVVNGGLEKWVAMGYPTTTDVPKYQEGHFEAVLRKDLIVSYEDIVNNLSSHHYQLVDSRPAAQFKGNDEDPKSGFIPGSKSIPHSDFLDKDTGLLKTIDAIKQMFAAQNINLDAPVIGSCNTATSASTLALIAKVMGKPDVPLYLGSFQEWKRRAEVKDIERPK